MKRIISVAEYIFKQSFRNKILNVLIIFAVFSIGFSLLISQLAQEVEQKMVTDFGLFAIGIFAFLTLALSITVQMFEENELKTISLVIVKPLKRYEFLIGKYLGIITTVFMNILFMLITLLLIIKLKGGDPWNIRIFIAVYTIFTGNIILAAVAVLFSVLATSVPGSIIYLFFTYVVGHLTVHLKHIAEQIDNVIVKGVIDIMYYVFPNLELFNLKDKIYTSDGLFAPEYILAMTGYALIYATLALVIATMLFEKKEF